MFYRLLASVGHTLAEQFVAATDIGLQQCHLIGVNRPGGIAEVGKFIGLYFIELDTQFLRQQLADIGEHAIDADGAGNGGRLSNDVVGRTADVVAT